MQLGRVSLYLLGVTIRTSGMLWYISTVNSLKRNRAARKWLSKIDIIVIIDYVILILINETTITR